MFLLLGYIFFGSPKAKKMQQIASIWEKQKCFYFDKWESFFFWLTINGDIFNKDELQTLKTILEKKKGQLS